MGVGGGVMIAFARCEAWEAALLSYFGGGRREDIGEDGEWREEKEEATLCRLERGREGGMAAEC